MKILNLSSPPTRAEAAKLGWWIANLDRRSFEQVGASIGVRLMFDPQRQRDLINLISRRPKSKLYPAKSKKTK